MTRGIRLENKGRQMERDAFNCRECDVIQGRKDDKRHKIRK